MAPCPHCHATAALERSASLRWRCAVCGGPLVPSDGSFPRAGAELASLVGAARTSAMALGWAASAIVLGAVAFVTLPMALMLWHVLHLGAVVLGGVAGVALALGFAAAMRSRGRRAETRRLLDEAWTTVAGELLAARGRDITAAEVARTLCVDEAYAETLLSELSAEGRVRVAVSDDAQLSYGPSPEAAAEAEPEPTRDGTQRGP